MTTWKSKVGPPLSMRSMPNTSQMTPNSNGAVPGMARTTIFCSIRALRGGIIDEVCRSCHSWLSVVKRRFTAMEIAIAVGVVAVAAAIVANVRIAMSDGYRQVPTHSSRPAH